MTGMIQALIGSYPNPASGGGFAGPTSSVTAPSGGSASISFSTNGTTTFGGSGGVPTGTQPNWHTPTTTNIGTSRWIRIDLISGTAPTSGSALGSWWQLNSTRTWTLNNGGVPGTTTGTYRVRIATDSLGTNVVSDTLAGGGTHSSLTVIQ